MCACGNNEGKVVDKSKKANMSSLKYEKPVGLVEVPQDTKSNGLESITYDTDDGIITIAMIPVEEEIGVDGYVNYFNSVNTIGLIPQDAVFGDAENLPGWSQATWTENEMRYIQLMCYDEGGFYRVSCLSFYPVPKGGEITEAEEAFLELKGTLAFKK